MRIFSIRNRISIYGYLFVNDKYDDCYMELNEGIEDYPIFFQSFIDKKKYTINSYWTYKWINERIVPYERRNINDILKDNNIPYYNEVLLLISSKGHSSMDDNYIEEVKIQDLDDRVKKRMEYHIIDFIYEKNQLIVFLKNNITYLIENINEEEVPFLSIFGNEIVYNSKVKYDYLYIKDNGKKFSLNYNSLINYINTNVLASKDIINELGFSRQYLNTLKKNNKIIVLDNDLYIKNNVKLYKK